MDKAAYRGGAKVVARKESEPSHSPINSDLNGNKKEEQKDDKSCIHDTTRHFEKKKREK